MNCREMKFLKSVVSKKSIITIFSSYVRTITYFHTCYFRLDQPELHAGYHVRLWMDVWPIATMGKEKTCGYVCVKTKSSNLRRHAGSMYTKEKCPSSEQCVHNYFHSNKTHVWIKTKLDNWYSDSFWRNPLGEHDSGLNARKRVHNKRRIFGEGNVALKAAPNLFLCTRIRLN